LIKWKGLEYEHCTWEQRSFIKKYFNQKIIEFKERQKAINKRKMKRSSKITSSKTPTSFKSFQEQPSFIKNKLYPFQFEGLNWLRYSWYQKTNVILAGQFLSLVLPQHKKFLSEC
jgi:SNF2 family DNA or RNA helicase